jgi:DNA-binding response OmpR family regulator
VLVLHENYVIASLLGDILEDCGCMVHLAPSVQEALLLANDSLLAWAILDTQAQGETTLPVAQLLAAKHVPYALTSLPQLWPVLYQEVLTLRWPPTAESLLRELKTLDSGI